MGRWRCRRIQRDENDERAHELPRWFHCLGDALLGGDLGGELSDDGPLGKQAGVILPIFGTLGPCFDAIVSGLRRGFEDPLKSGLGVPNGGRDQCLKSDRTRNRAFVDGGAVHARLRDGVANTFEGLHETELGVCWVGELGFEVGGGDDVSATICECSDQDHGGVFDVGSHSENLISRERRQGAVAHPVQYWVKRAEKVSFGPRRVVVAAKGVSKERFALGLRGGQLEQLRDLAVREVRLWQVRQALLEVFRRDELHDRILGILSPLHAVG